MGNKLINIFIALGIFLIVPVSCIKEDMGSENCDMTYVTFSLRIERETRSLTRAETWGDEYNKSAYENDYDNYIDITSLQVLLFDSSTNIYAGTLEDMFYQSAPGADYITFTGKAPSSLTPKSYKIVILANAGITALTVDSSTLSDLYSLTYTLYENSSPKDIAIPMWGITTADLTLVKGAKQDIGTIYLLRSMARVVVYLNQNVYLSGSTEKFADRYDIKSVSISNYNQSGYVLPSTYADVSETTEITTEDGSFNEYVTSATDLTVSSTILMNSVSGDSVIVYLPEIENSDGSVKISVTLTGNNIDSTSTDYSYEDAITFLQDTAYCDIVRNHSYNFKINGAYNGSLTATLEVLPWDLLEEEISISDSFVINGGGYLDFNLLGNGVILSSDSLGRTCTFPQDSSNSVVLPFFFQIDGPLNAYWEANIINTTPADPDFVFCDESGNVITDGTISTGSTTLPITNVFMAGIIDGQRDTLYAKCTRTPGTSSYSAELKFYFYNPTTLTTYIIENMIDNSGTEKTVTFKLDPAS